MHGVNGDNCVAKRHHHAGSCDAVWWSSSLSRPSRLGGNELEPGSTHDNDFDTYSGNLCNKHNEDMLQMV